LETYLKLAQATHETIETQKSLYTAVNDRVEKQAEKDFGKYLNFIDLEFKFISAKKKLGKVKEETYRSYRSTFKKLIDYFYKKEIANITIEDYEEFREHLSKVDKIKNKTINNHLSYTSNFLDYAVSRKLIPENNIKGIGNLKEEDADKENFTDEDIKNILAYDYNEPPLTNFYLIAMYSGMRQEDIYRLTKESIKEEKGIYYFDILEGKTKNSVRKVPIHEDILEKVLEMDFPLFKNKTLNATQKILNRRLYKVVDKNSTKSFHTFRAKFISKAINANPEKIVVVQDIVGHSKSDKDKLTIDTYGKGFDLDLKAMVVNTVRYD
jgi:integrase